MFKFYYSDNNKMSSKGENMTTNNITMIILYALALAAALGLNDLILTIFDKFDWSHTGKIISKTIYVILMFTVVLLISYFTQSKVSI